MNEATYGRMQGNRDKAGRMRETALSHVDDLIAEALKGVEASETSPLALELKRFFDEPVQRTENDAYGRTLEQEVAPITRKEEIVGEVIARYASGMVDETNIEDEILTGIKAALEKRMAN